MSTLRTRLIRLAAARPELRADLLPLLQEQADPASVDQNKPESYYGLPPRGVQAAAKAPAKLKGKKLDEAISKAYYKYGDRVQVNILDIGKIYAAGKAAYEGAATPEEADKALDAAMKAALEKYGTVSKVASSFRDYDEAYVEAVGKANRLRLPQDLWKNRMTGQYTVSGFSPSVDTARGEVIKPGTPLTDKQQAIADHKRSASRTAAYRDYNQAKAEAFEIATRLRRPVEVLKNRKFGIYEVNLFVPGEDTVRGEIVHAGTPLTPKQQGFLRGVVNPPPLGETVGGEILPSSTSISRRA